MARTSPYLSSTDPALVGLSAGSFSISFWVQVSDPTKVAAGTVLLSAPGFTVTLTSMGVVEFSVIGDSVTTVVDSSAPLLLGWNNVIVSYDLPNTLASVFLDGLTATGTFTQAAITGPGSFRVGEPDREDSPSGNSATFGMDSLTVWNRLLTATEIKFIYSLGTGQTYPFLGGAFNLIFQATLINDPPAPLVLATGSSIYYAAESFDGSFLASLTPLYSGNQISTGFNWKADNFSDKILFAQRDNRCQYWTPPLPNLALDVPGLPSNDAQWDGVTVFANHALLWRDDRLKWSDVNDFTTWIPVATTAISAVFTLATDYIQPPVGGNVSITIINPVAAVKSISLDGDLAFPSTAVGTSSEAVLIIINSGTADLTVSGISLPEGFTGSFAGVIPVGQSQPVTLTFTPTAAVSYDGAVNVASNATTGTSSAPVTGTGTGVTKIIDLSGILAFSPTRTDRTETSSVIITNSGNATLNITGMTVPTGFSHGSIPSTIAAGAFAAVTITFQPTSASSFAGFITVTSDSTSGDNTMVVTGTGVTGHSGVPQIFLTDNGTCQFGKVPTGTTVSTGVLKIYNDSDTPYTVLGLTLPDGFTGAFTGTVGGASTVSVTISFSPTDPVDYAGLVYVSTGSTDVGPVVGLNAIPVSGTGTSTGKIIALSGDLNFGDVPINNTVQALLKIQNVGTVALTVSSITYPTGFSGDYTGTIAPGDTKFVLVKFSPTSVTTYTGNLTVNSDATVPAATFPVTGTGFSLPGPDQLVAGQFITMTDMRDGVTYYNFYSVVSMAGTNIVLTLQDLTGATPSGDNIPSDGRQFFTVDSNEAGEDRIVGAKQNGPIYRVIPQGDYAYSYKERSIQSIQYTGLGNGTFFVHNEISDEGLISRDAIAVRGGDGNGVHVFLGHRELYTYSGGPNLTPVCQQTTRQLYAELDRTRLSAIRVFHNETRKEIWVSYPVVGGFKVLIWNYVEDSSSIDDYNPALEFTALGLVDWSNLDHAPIFASQDGNLRVHGLVYNRDGAAYTCISETMDFDFRSPDNLKYVDVIVLGIEVKAPDTVTRNLFVQVGSQNSLSGADIVWSDPKAILVNGRAKLPVKVNPGQTARGGRYIRVRFSSQDPDVQWRISSFEIHTRPGATY